MIRSSASARSRSPAVEAYLLGTVDYDDCLALQNRLVYEASGRNDGQITLLVCEHQPIITVGRRGSWGHIALDQRELASRQLDVRWVNHGGGCLAHLPGQLAIYPIVPLQWHGFTVGDYLDRLQRALVDTITELGFAPITRERQQGVWGRSGQLAAIGVAVKSWVTYHGAFLNVAPAMDVFRLLATDPAGGAPMSSLAAERQKYVKMTQAREAAVRHMVAALGCVRHHVHSGHPLWRPSPPCQEPTASRVG
jgi:lipoyl(octanoyl) transferase